MKFEETSAKENISINKVFEDMAELLYEDYIKSGGKKKSKNQQNLRMILKRKKIVIVFVPKMLMYKMI